MNYISEEFGDFYRDDSGFCLVMDAQVGFVKLNIV